MIVFLWNRKIMLLMLGMLKDPSSKRTFTISLENVVITTIIGNMIITIIFIDFEIFILNNFLFPSLASFESIGYIIVDIATAITPTANIFSLLA